MRKALLWTFSATALLLAAGLHQTTTAMPIAAPAIGTSESQDAIPTQQARLICGWWGHFECVRVCPAAYHRYRHHRYYYPCEPLVLGLPWI